MSVAFEEAAGTHGAEIMSVNTFVKPAALIYIPSRATYGAFGSRIERNVASVFIVYTPPALWVTMLTCWTLTFRSSAGTVSSQTCIRISSETGVDPPIPGLHHRLESQLMIVPLRDSCRSHTFLGKLLARRSPWQVCPVRVQTSGYQTWVVQIIRPAVIRRRSCSWWRRSLVDEDGPGSLAAIDTGADVPRSLLRARCRVQTRTHRRKPSMLGCETNG